MRHHVSLILCTDTKELSQEGAGNFLGNVFYVAPSWLSWNFSYPMVGVYQWRGLSNFTRTPSMAEDHWKEEQTIDNAHCQLDLRQTLHLAPATVNGLDPSDGSLHGPSEILCISLAGLEMYDTRARRKRIMSPLSINWMV